MQQKKAKVAKAPIMRKKAEKPEADNRLIFTEHTSFASKPLQRKKQPEAKVSRTNMDYLTSSKQASKGVTSSYTKGATKKSQIAFKKEESTKEKYDYLDEDVSPQYTQETKVKTVFQRPVEEEQNSKECNLNVEQVGQAEIEVFDDHQKYKKPHPPQPKKQSKKSEVIGVEADDNFVSLDKLHLSNKKLGEGGFSFVYEGQWLGSNVAVKVINITNKNTESKAIKEIQTLIKLRHPRIIQLFKYSLEQTKTGTHIYIIMQLMQGDLTSYQYSKGLYDRMKVIKQTAEALRMLHEESIVHRDIKPQNILYDLKGDIKLADLGISAVLDSEQTHSITVAYTLKYAPREVCIDEITDLKNDIWSFGLVIYEILTGIPPWRNCKKGQITQGLITRKFPLDENWKQKLEQVLISPENTAIFISLIEDCLKYDMQDRPTIAQVQDRLNKLTVPPPTPVYHKITLI